jgi:hypothetical protein
MPWEVGRRTLVRKRGRSSWRGQAS